MTDTWLGDTCSLVDAFRKGERSPVEELQATYDAIACSRGVKQKAFRSLASIAS